MSDNVSIVLVGLGGYGGTYVNELLDSPDIHNIRIAGLVEPYPDSCKRLEELKQLGAPIYNDITDFYAEHSADLAVISSPIQFHTNHIITALSHGSNVLCEKPLCGDARDIEKIITARDSAGKFVDIGYQWSHNEGILEMKRDILDGRYGKPKKLKSITLWPRDEAYFKRGTGWAGTIRAKDGTLVYDSVANNATAHYLHNMFFILGGSMNSSLAPTDTKAFLIRANPIENFDSCVLNCGMPDGTDVVFVSAHAVHKYVGPVCEYSFEKGTIRLDSLPDEAGEHDIKGHFVGITESGEVKDYGDPQINSARKLHLAIEAVRTNGEVCCPVEAAEVHTRVINHIQESFPIHQARSGLVKVSERSVTYIDGLDDAMISIYRGNNVDLNNFCE